MFGRHRLSFDQILKDVFWVIPITIQILFFLNNLWCSFRRRFINNLNLWGSLNNFNEIFATIFIVAESDLGLSSDLMFDHNLIFIFFWDFLDLRNFVKCLNFLWLCMFDLAKNLDIRNRKLPLSLDLLLLYYYGLLLHNNNFLLYHHSLLLWTLSLNLSRVASLTYCRLLNCLALTITCRYFNEGLGYRLLVFSLTPEMLM